MENYIMFKFNEKDIQLAAFIWRKTTAVRPIPAQDWNNAISQLSACFYEKQQQQIVFKQFIFQEKFIFFKDICRLQNNFASLKKTSSFGRLFPKSSNSTAKII